MIQREIQLNSGSAMDDKELIDDLEAPMPDELMRLIDRGELTNTI